MMAESGEFKLRALTQYSDNICYFDSDDPGAYKNVNKPDQENSVWKYVKILNIHSSYRPVNNVDYEDYTLFMSTVAHDYKSLEFDAFIEKYDSGGGTKEGYTGVFEQGSVDNQRSGGSKWSI